MEDLRFAVESVASRILELEDIGWAKLNNAITNGESEGPTFEEIQKIIPMLRELSATNPWHKRGVQLWTSYVFGRGVSYTNCEKPKVQKALNDRDNRKVLFSAGAYAENIKTDFTDGTFLIIRKKGDKFQRFPFSQVTGVSTDPDDPGTIWYVKRSWSANGEDYERWYPVAAFKRSGVGIRRSIQAGPGGPSVPVDQDATVYIKTLDQQVGWTWGVPGSLAAVPWTIAYSEYLKDNVQLVKALSVIAWKTTSESPKAAQETAAAVRESTGVGQTASMLNGSNLQGVGVPSAQVNMGNGQPIISGVATSFGVPVIALISSPGETGGSYGAATTLDEPTLKGFTFMQQSWSDFYEEILFDLGAKEGRMEFPAINTDLPYRQIQVLLNAHAQGALWQDETRNAVLDILDVEKLHEQLPKADGFNTYSTPEDPYADEEDVNDPNARQGNTGAVQGGTDQGDTNHDLDGDRE